MSDITAAIWTTEYAAVVLRVVPLANRFSPNRAGRVASSRSTTRHAHRTAPAASICNDLRAKAAQPRAGSYTECFDALRGLGIVDNELADRLIRMARFRKVLVHRYWHVDPARVLEYARADLGDLEAFLERAWSAWAGTSAGSCSRRPLGSHFV